MATVTFSLGAIDLGGFTGQTVTVTVKSQSTPSLVGTQIIPTAQKTITLDSNGNGSTTLAPGLYSVTFKGGPYSTNKDNVVISVPNNNGTVAWWQIVVSGVVSSFAVGSVIPNQFIIDGPSIGVNGLIGGTGFLDGVATVSAAGSTYLVYDSVYGNGWGLWNIQTGAQTVSDPTNGLVVPLDHATSGNVFKHIL